jgi:ABC-type Fe3+/spermidine/putrescine transport system ATPase subunit
MNYSQKTNGVTPMIDLRSRSSRGAVAAYDHDTDTGITVEGVSKSFGGTPILRSLDLAVEPGVFLTLLGPSGCGKTTLLRCIAGLETPDEGRITIGQSTVVDMVTGRFVPPERRGLGMVFQQYALWPHKTILENIAYPLRKRGMARAERDERVRSIAATVGLSATLTRRPRQLSGGQQQRVALARALVHEPPVLLLDEPLSNVDATLRHQLRRELRDLHERLGTTSVLVTHDQEEAAGVADVIAVIQDGRVVQLGQPQEILERPATRFVADFVGFDNFIDGTLARVSQDVVEIALEADSGRLVVDAPPVDLREGTLVQIGARSDALTIVALPGDRTVEATVRRVVPVGSAVEIEAHIGHRTVTVRQAGGRLDDYNVNESVLIEFPVSAAILAR